MIPANVIQGSVSEEASPFFDYQADRLNVVLLNVHEPVEIDQAIDHGPSDVLGCDPDDLEVSHRDPRPVRRQDGRMNAPRDDTAHEFEAPSRDPARPGSPNFIYIGTKESSSRLENSQVVRNK